MTAAESLRSLSPIILGLPPQLDIKSWSAQNDEQTSLIGEKMVQVGKQQEMKWSWIKLRSGCKGPWHKTDKVDSPLPWESGEALEILKLGKWHDYNDALGSISDKSVYVILIDITWQRSPVVN